MFNTIHQSQDSSYFLWVGERKDTSDTHPFLIECYSKQPESIKYLIVNAVDFKKYEVPDYQLKCTIHGYKSPRPYLPGQACDGTIGAPVLFLFHHFCLQHNLQTEVAYNHAYASHGNGDTLDTEELSSILAFATWQGVLPPDIWNHSNYHLLIQSLTNANHSSLVQYLLELEIYSNPFTESITL